MKYSDALADWLVELGYKRCFFVGGGNIMHILESASKRFEMTSVIHEVAAGIAAEYYNQVSADGRAFVLVTAGPGMTNVVTAMAGAYLESRELLVIGGQVKTADLSRGKLRQRGIQEIDGVSIAAPISVASVLIDDVLDQAAFSELAERGSHGRPGPVFLEIPLDIQGRDVDIAALAKPVARPGNAAAAEAATAGARAIVEAIRAAKRPFILLGGGVDRRATRGAGDALAKIGVPLATTWNGADRIAADHPLYFGRPNTWGQRYANLVMQQADLVVALGSRLGLQQTGFNWEEFAPVGKVAQVDLDRAELDKGHPKVDIAVCADANAVLRELLEAELGDHADWVAYCRNVKAALPLDDSANQTRQGHVSPFQFGQTLSELCAADDIITPCSSGGAFTSMMQTFAQKDGQTIVTNKALASMGYGLSGAIGAAFAGQGRRTVLVEGDGGFAQNLQEVGTAAINNLNLKMFLFDDGGYASIRMTQRNYFGGSYIGCDRSSGLGLPDWEKLFAAYDVPALRLAPGFDTDAAFLALWNAPGTAAFIVPIDAEQTYFPKITSRVSENGGMVSNPLHKMSPDLEAKTLEIVGKYLP